MRSLIHSLTHPHVYAHSFPYTRTFTRIKSRTIAPEIFRTNQHYNIRYAVGLCVHVFPVPMVADVLPRFFFYPDLSTIYMSPVLYCFQHTVLLVVRILNSIYVYKVVLV